MKYYTNIFIFIGYFCLSLISLLNAYKYLKKGLYIQMTSYISLCIGTLLLGVSYGKQLLIDLDDTMNTLTSKLKMYGHLLYSLYIIILLVSYLLFKKLKIKFNPLDYIGLIAHMLFFFIVYYHLNHTIHIYATLLLVSYYLLSDYYYYEYTNNTFKVITYLLISIGFIFYLYIDNKVYDKVYTMLKTSETTNYISSETTKQA